MKKRITAVLMVCVMVAGMVMGCGKTEGVATTSDEATVETAEGAEFKIGIYLWPSWYEWFVAEDKGFFTEAGLNVELVPFTSYSDMLQAFYSGKINVVGATVCDMIAGYNEGKDFKITFVNDYSTGADAIVFGNNISTPEDIKGKEIAVEVGTLEHYMLLTALDKWGIDQSEVLITNMSMSDAAPAMLSGSVEVAAMADPYGEEVVNAGKGTKYFTSADVPGLISDATAISGELIKNYPEEVQKLTDVWYQTVEWVEANKDEGIKIMADEAELSVEEYELLFDGVTILSRDAMIAGFNDKKDEYTYVPYVAKENADFLLGQELITESKDSYDEMFDGSFVSNK